MIPQRGKIQTNTYVNTNTRKIIIENCNRYKTAGQIEKKIYKNAMQSNSNITDYQFIFIYFLFMITVVRRTLVLIANVNSLTTFRLSMWGHPQLQQLLYFSG